MATVATAITAYKAAATLSDLIRKAIGYMHQIRNARETGEALLRKLQSMESHLDKLLNLYDKSTKSRAAPEDERVLEQLLGSWLRQPLEDHIHSMEDLLPQLSGPEQKKKPMLKRIMQIPKRTIHNVKAVRTEKTVQEYASKLDQFLDLLNRNVIVDIRDTQLTAVIEGKRKEIIAWLSPAPYQVSYERFIKVRQQGTNSWLFDNAAYKHWEQSASAFLSLFGKAGSGKTILASSVIKSLHDKRDTKRAIIAYHFCRFDDPKSTEPATVMRTLLSQIIGALHGIQLPESDFADLIERMDNSQPPPQEIADLCNLLKKAVDLKSCPVFMIVDGLDELSEREQVLELLRCLPKLVRTSSLVRVLVTSRPEDHIKLELRMHPAIDLSDERKAINNDIGRYIDQEMNSGDQKLRDLPPEFKQEVIQKLTSGADGMFFWVRCQLDSLAEQANVAGMKHVLQNLPHGLKETYMRIVSGIDDRGKHVVELAERILSLLVAATGPVHIDEICDAMKISLSTRTINEEDGLCRPEEVRRICKSLIDYNEKTREVSLAHFSVREFLLEHRQETSLKIFHIPLDDPLLHVTKLALSYISIIVLQSPNTLLNCDEHSFCNYIAFNMGSFLHRLLPSDTTDDLHDLENVLNTCAPTLLQWLRSWHRIGSRSFIHRLLRSLVRLPSPSSLSLCGVVFPSTPLFNAIYFNNLALADLLLHCGADIDMSVAVEYERGADIDMSVIIAIIKKFERTDWFFNGSRCSAMWVAIGQADYKAFKFLLSHGACLQLKDGLMGDHAILWAAYNGQENMIRVMLSKGEGVDVRAVDGSTALHCAALSGSLDVVRYLVEAGCDVNARNHRGHTPIQIEDVPIHQKITNFLVENGAIPAEYVPTTCMDVLKTAWTLQHSISHPLPLPLVRRILNFAGYWVRQRSSLTSSPDFSGGNPGIKAKISGMPERPLRKVVFAITSRINDRPPASKRSVRVVYPYLEVVCESDEPESGWRKTIELSLRRYDLAPLHVIIWDVADDGDWIAMSKAGDELKIRASVEDISFLPSDRKTYLGLSLSVDIFSACV